jgi:hypothetical protein
MTIEIEYASKDISVFAALLEEKQPAVSLPSTGPDFYDYECGLKALWKVWHKDQKK